MLLQSASEIIDEQEAPRADYGPSEWREVDRRLREYARHRASLDAAEAFDLLRAEQLKLHFLHGFATMYEYLERVLGHGPHAARERMRVARTLARLPQTTAALARGALTYSAVRELTRVLATSLRRSTAGLAELAAAHRGGRTSTPSTGGTTGAAVELEPHPLGGAGGGRLSATRIMSSSICRTGGRPRHRRSGAARDGGAGPRADAVNGVPPVAASGLPRARIRPARHLYPLRVPAREARLRVWDTGHPGWSWRLDL